MFHSFNVTVATAHGIEQAIVIHFMMHWMEKNAANKTNIYDGAVWTFNSCAALHKIFPYMSSKKISRLLTSMEENRLIRSGNYNKSQYDRTKWYTVIDSEIINFYHALHLTDLGNGKSENVQPIPVNNTVKENPISPFVDKLYALYPTKCVVSGRSSGKSSVCKAKLKTLLKKRPADSIAKGIKWYIETCRRDNCYMKNFSTFLNNFPDESEYGYKPSTASKIDQPVDPRWLRIAKEHGLTAEEAFDLGLHEPIETNTDILMKADLRDIFIRTGDSEEYKKKKDWMYKRYQLNVEIYQQEWHLNNLIYNLERSGDA